MLVIKSFNNFSNYSMHRKLLLLSINIILLLCDCHGDYIPSGILQNFKTFNGVINRRHSAIHTFTANITSLVNEVSKLITVMNMSTFDISYQSR